MPHSEIPVERRQGRFVEDLADQPEVLVDEDVRPVGNRDPGGFLPSVLLGEKTEVREPGNLVAGCPYAEEPAFLFR